MADAAQLSSLADETPEGRSIVVLAKEKYELRGREFATHEAEFIPFTAQTRMSGVNLDGREIRKGAAESIAHYLEQNNGADAAGGARRRRADRVVRRNSAGGRREPARLGVIHLKDVVKGGMRDRFDQLRAMGIRTVMITGDNPLTAAAIAREAGVDDFLAQATPEDKMNLIRTEQAGGKLVAMTGDGTNDAPALAQADVGVAMNTGTQAAKEAGNMVDLDSNPTKLIEVVEIGKQLLMTRGALTTFSIANDVAKYFAIIPAMFAATFPVLNALNIMHLKTPQSAVLSAVIFNALIIIALDSAGAARREVSRHERRGAAAPQSLDLRRGRTDRAIHRHQDHRPAHHRRWTGLRTYEEESDYRVPDDHRDHDPAGIDLSAGDHWAGAASLSRQGQRPDHHAQRRSDRLAHHRTAVHSAQVFPLATFSRRQWIRRGELRQARNLGPTNQKLIDRIQADAKTSARGKSCPVDSCRSDHDFGLGIRSRHFSRSRGVSDSTRGARAWHAESALRDLVQKHTAQRDLGLLGEPE